jgi:hypothetical protein
MEEKTKFETSVLMEIALTAPTPVGETCEDDEDDVEDEDDDDVEDLSWPLEDEDDVEDDDVEDLSWLLEMRPPKNDVADQLANL